MTKSLRKKIERHFKSYELDKAARKYDEGDILDSRLTSNLSRVGNSFKVGNPTEDKAIQILEISAFRDWPAVVENTFTAFKYKEEYETMKALYIDGRDYKDLLGEGLNGSTFFRRRDKWLEYAYKCAKEYMLL